MPAIQFNISSDIDLTEVYGVLAERLEEVTEVYRQSAYNNCPVNTGYLRSTIGSKVDGNEGTVYATADYASYTEFRPNTTCTHWFSGAMVQAEKEALKLWQKPI